MSRIQVGEITIDGENVRIGNADNLPQAQSSRPALAPSIDPLAIATLIPGRPGLLALIGAGMMAAGTVVNLVVGVLSDPVRALLYGGVMAPLGVGLLGLALLKAWTVRASPVALASSLEGGPEQYIATLRPLLQGGPEACTVAALARATRCSEPTVVRALALMRERGEVAEELDFDTGQFYYTTRTLPPRDLDSRLGQLHP
jgi:hypothetical protein